MVGPDPDQYVAKVHYSYKKQEPQDADKYFLYNWQK